MPSTHSFAFLPLLSKSAKALFLFIFALSVNSKVLLAQADKQTMYVAINFVKSTAGKGGLYADLLKTYSTKLQEDYFKSGKILGWYTHTVEMPVGSSAEYDMTVVTVTTDLKILLYDTTSFRDRFKKTFPELSENTVETILDSYGASRTLVKREIYTFVDGLNMSGPPSKFIQVDFMKPTAGKTADYVKLEKDIYKPLHAEMAKAGNKDDWGLYQKQMPYSDNDAYDYITANFFKSINQMMSGDYAATFKKVFPKMDINTVTTQTNNARKIVRSELWKLGVFVDGTNTKK